jgi:hypothetical protein
MKEEAREIARWPWDKVGTPLILGMGISFPVTVLVQKCSGLTVHWLLLIVPGTVVGWHLVDTIALFRWARRQNYH